MHFRTHIRQRLNSCTLLEDACAHFDSLFERNVYLWNTIIGVQAKHGRSMQSLQLFQQMQQESTIPDNVTVIHMLSLYTRLELLADGRRLHSCLLQEMVASDVVMGTALLTMYGRLGLVELAEGVFCQTKEKDVTSWNAMMKIYAQNGQDSNVMQLFYQMQLTELDPDKETGM
ncbi:hypothetical protein GOP47_0009276 [Adiantum capillus-veneris]|uniref:Pentatricopeptide repeat-containing protein n=1 Tax=Adiantum capillus-veneris TaxID=13818 RepID=A0A9D4UWQ1_ADICA|nr:hypothetical protein GOP47_0009276 [Adiantum capillus-veneris]